MSNTSEIMQDVSLLSSEYNNRNTERQKTNISSKKTLHIDMSGSKHTQLVNVHLKPNLPSLQESTEISELSKTTKTQEQSNLPIDTCRNILTSNNYKQTPKEYISSFVNNESLNANSCPLTYILPEYKHWSHLTNISQKKKNIALEAKGHQYHKNYNNYSYISKCSPYKSFSISINSEINSLPTSDFNFFQMSTFWPSSFHLHNNKDSYSHVSTTSKQHARSLSNEDLYNFQHIIPHENTSTVSASYENLQESPASHFLNLFSTTSPNIYPDEEGQQIGKYIIGKPIAHGSYSIVKEAITIENGFKSIYAVKIVRKSVNGKNDIIQAEIEKELEIWKLLDHPHILPLFSVEDTQFATFCFTIKFSGGTLYDILKKEKGYGLSNSKAKRYSYQLASALRYLHQDIRLVHLDVKLENCLLDTSELESNRLLLCDFGMAEFISSASIDDIDNSASSTNSKLISTSTRGSLPYVSPEIISSGKTIKEASTDIWSYGILLHALITGTLPFTHMYSPLLQMQILKGDWDIETLRKIAHQDSFDLILGCLQPNPKKRWTIENVLNSKWLQSYNY
ncbi:hypothetical protein PMAC_002989 [Pneumocystis sp. 'macacae']|nr:hypothetical protein PMAC_002989 [Pneumocystis sp. 'macacae']